MSSQDAPGYGEPKTSPAGLPVARRFASIQRCENVREVVGRDAGAAVFAHIFAIAGFLLGIWATRAGTSPFNANYHRVMLVVFVAGLALLLIPGGRAALGRNKRLVR